MHSRKALFVGLLLAAALFVLPEASADQVNIVADRDNTLYEDVQGGISNGAGAHLFAGKTRFNLTRRALIHFDIAGNIPVGSTIDSVTLSFTVSRVRTLAARDLRVRRVTANWGEGSANASGNEGGGTGASGGDATWLHTFNPKLTWNNAGGDFFGPISATVTLGNTGDYQVASTAALVSDVQGWLDAPANNFGWILRGIESEPSTSKRMNSREHAQASTHPTLTVDFTPPAPEIACRFSRVNAGSGTATDVLSINGSFGDSERVVNVGVGAPILVAMNSSPAGPSPAPFVLWLWLGEPTPGTVVPLPKNLGDLCFPFLFVGGKPQPTKIWNNIGRFNKLGSPDFPSSPAPSIVVSAPQGTQTMATATLQGIMADDGSSADAPASITNATILKIQ